MNLFCVICCARVPEKRAARGSVYCSNACRHKYRVWRRAWQAERHCRLCGRRLRRPVSAPNNVSLAPDTRRAEKTEISPCALGAQATPHVAAD
jgi:hypothetical protein